MSEKSRDGLEHLSDVLIYSQRKSKNDGGNKYQVADAEARVEYFIFHLANYLFCSGVISGLQWARNCGIRLCFCMRGG